LADVELVETIGGIPSRHRHLWEEVFFFNCIHREKIEELKDKIIYSKERERIYKFNFQMGF
jgi:hypothetical protein